MTRKKNSQVQFGCSISAFACWCWGLLVFRPRFKTRTPPQIQSRTTSHLIWNMYLCYCNSDTLGYSTCSPPVGTCWQPCHDMYHCYQLVFLSVSVSRNFESWVRGLVTCRSLRRGVPCRRWSSCGQAEQQSDWLPADRAPSSRAALPSSVPTCCLSDTLNVMLQPNIIRCLYNILANSKFVRK